MLSYSSTFVGTDGDDYLELTTVFSGGEAVYLDGGDGYDTLDTSSIFIADPFRMFFRCYDNDDDFAGYDTIQFGDFRAQNFEVIGREGYSRWH